VSRSAIRLGQVFSSKASEVVGKAKKALLATERVNVVRLKALLLARGKVVSVSECVFVDFFH